MPVPKPFPFRLDFPPELPISARAEEIVAALQANPVLVLAGETGSGKTTQIPKMCLAAGGGTRGRIACTQPRRVAALSVSRRVAEELGVAWGREVGCKVRFNDETSSATVIKFLTDGMLLAEVQGDPLLREYDTIIIDEAHERSLNIDFLLGHLRQLRFKRPELKIVITSATIDTAAFSKAFEDAPVIEVSGRTYPVEVVYAPLNELGADTADGDEPAAKAEALHYIDGAVEAVERILHQSRSGDILVFMPAERDIREMRELLEGGRSFAGCEIVPLFGRLSNAEQQRVFASSQRRKIVVATNIAETSLTIPGIRFVVDTGLARISRYAPQARTRRLPIEEIAQSSADQRKGRCGRVAEGVCIRLYSEKDYLERPRFTQPEIQRANLADVILRMKAFGLGDIERFPFINLPATKAVRAGYALLEELGAMTAAERDRGAGEGGGSAAGGQATPPAEPALPGGWSLTPLGRELARLPVDPTVGRMILQAREEKCLREVLVIAAGLSIQDPRERPLDAREKADAAHRRFAHPDSDFLTLLAIWEAFHEEFETMSQAKLRRFCRDHFLSYTRMREWRDIHAQLVDVLSERESFRITSVFDGVKARPPAQGPGAHPKSGQGQAAAGRGRGGQAPDNAKMLWGTPAYRAIHRAILAGLLSNIALRDDETGLYKATHDRKVALFPGSTLFVRDNEKRGADPRRAPKKEGRAPRWLMAAEIMETSRLYARTCARLDPLWALDLGAHLVKVSHSEPFWNPDGGRVLVKQRTRLYGLELESRAVSFGRIDPEAATEIFIREALVNDTVTWPFDFLDHNRKVRERIENLLTRARDSGYMNLDEAVYRFYAGRLFDDDAGDEPRGVSSVAELVDLVRERKAAEPRFLMMEESDLRPPEELQQDSEAYPEALPLDNRALPLNYAYKPGQSDDGVTLDVNVREAEALNLQALDWAVPGHLPAKVEHYLRAAPKELRRAFVPLAETARSMADSLRLVAAAGARAPQTLVEALAAELSKRYRIRVDPTWWAGRPLPQHLQVRVRVLDDEGGEICASRDLAEIQAALQARSRELSRTVGREDPEAWRRARSRWEKPDQTEWTFGDLPRQVPVTEQAGVPVLAYPGLRAGGEGVALHLFRTPEEADAATRGGLQRLIELKLRYELAWLQKDLRSLRELGALTSTLAKMESLQAQAYDSIRRWICDPARVLPGELSDGAWLARAADFAAAVERAKLDLRGLAPRLVERLREILEPRQALLVHPQPYAGMERDLGLLLPPDFLRLVPYRQLGHLARYLKAMKVRADRWRQNPAKDAERARVLAPYAAAAARWAGLGPDELTPEQSAFRWLVEEFRVSLFAQELGTAEPVSPVKLDKALALAGGVAKAPPTDTPPAGREPARPPLAAPAEAKGKPLKSLGALDSLFRR